MLRLPLLWMFGVLLPSSNAITKSFVNSSMPNIRPTFVVNFDTGTVVCQHSLHPDDLHLHSISIICDGNSDCYSNPAIHDENFPYCGKNCSSACNQRGACLFNGAQEQCYCNAGYYGPHCELSDDEECKDKSCHWLAYCRNTHGLDSCTCLPGFQGDGHECSDINECETEIAQCPEHSACVNLPGTYYCNCTEGFQPLGTPLERCADIDECAGQMHNCPKDFKCQNEIGRFKCVEECDTGYRLMNGTCVDINECIEKTSKCDNRASCMNTEGSYQCLCQEGFVGDGKNCKPLNDCSQQESVCDRHAFCIDTLRMCLCQSGYVGDGLNCYDVNECDAKRDPCKGQTDGLRCVNIDGGYICCEQHLDDKTCIREKGAFCSGGCGLHAVCYNETCQCMEGFSGDPRVNCFDINECENDKQCLGAGEWCVNLFGGFICCSDESKNPECLRSNNSKLSGIKRTFSTGTVQERETSGFMIINRKVVSLERLGLACYFGCPADSHCVDGICRCNNGFIGNTFEGCTDVNECQLGLCNQSDSWCVNLRGSFACCTTNSTLSDCMVQEITGNHINDLDSKRKHFALPFTIEKIANSLGAVSTSIPDAGNVNESWLDSIGESKLGVGEGRNGWSIQKVKEWRNFTGHSIIFGRGRIENIENKKWSLTRDKNGALIGIEVDGNRTEEKYSASSIKEEIDESDNNGETEGSGEGISTNDILGLERETDNAIVTSPSLEAYRSNEKAREIVLEITTAGSLLTVSSVNEVKKVRDDEIVTSQSLKTSMNHMPTESRISLEKSSESPAPAFLTETPQSPKTLSSEAFERGKVSETATYSKDAESVPTSSMASAEVEITTVFEMDEAEGTIIVTESNLTQSNASNNIRTTVGDEETISIKQSEVAEEPSTTSFQRQVHSSLTSHDRAKVTESAISSSIPQRESQWKKEGTQKFQPKNITTTMSETDVINSVEQNTTTPTAVNNKGTVSVIPELDSTGSISTSHSGTERLKKFLETSTPSRERSHRTTVDFGLEIVNAAFMTEQHSGIETMGILGESSETADLNATYSKTTKPVQRMGTMEFESNSMSVAERTEDKVLELIHTSAPIETTQTKVSTITSSAEATTVFESKEVSSIFGQTPNSNGSNKMLLRSLVIEKLSKNNLSSFNQLFTEQPNKASVPFIDKSPETIATVNSLTTASFIPTDSGNEILKESFKTETVEFRTSTVTNDLLVKLKDGEVTAKVTTMTGGVPDHESVEGEEVLESQTASSANVFVSDTDLQTVTTTDDKIHEVGLEIVLANAHRKTTEPIIDEKSTSLQKKWTVDMPSNAILNASISLPFADESESTYIRTTPQSITGKSTDEKFSTFDPHGTEESKTISSDDFKKTDGKIKVNITQKMETAPEAGSGKQQDSSKDGKVVSNEKLDLTTSIYRPEMASTSVLEVSETTVLHASDRKVGAVTTLSTEFSSFPTKEILVKASETTDTSLATQNIAKIKTATGTGKDVMNTVQGTSYSTVDSLNINPESVTMAITERATWKLGSSSTTESVKPRVSEGSPEGKHAKSGTKASGIVDIIKSSVHRNIATVTHPESSTSETFLGDGVIGTPSSKNIIVLQHYKSSKEDLSSTGMPPRNNLGIVSAVDKSKLFETESEANAGRMKPKGAKESDVSGREAASIISGTETFRSTTNPPLFSMESKQTSASEESSLKTTEQEIVSPRYSRPVEATKKARTQYEITETSLTKSTTPFIPSRCRSSNECGKDAYCERRSGVCRCHPGFYGQPPTTPCVDIDECDQHLVDCGSTSRCSNILGGFMCFCETGYRMSKEHVCVDIDECQERAGQTCSQYATCINMPGSYRCQCDPGYTGDGYTCIPIEMRHCKEDELAKSNCARNHLCLVNGRGEIDCDSCKKGFVKEGSNCVDVNECTQTALCHENAFCENINGSYLCHCHSGYKGDGHKCDDIDECQNNPCHPQSICINEPGSFTCKCPDEWIGDGKNECVNPSEAACLNKLLVCNQVNHTSCLSVNLGTVTASICECAANYRYNHMKHICEDIDECIENRHSCDLSNSVCVNTDGGYSCVCAAGYEGVGGVCVDINECERGIAGCNAPARCENYLGSVGCICPPGFISKGANCIEIESTTRSSSDSSCSHEWKRTCYSMNRTCHIDDEDVQQCGSCLIGYQPLNGRCLPVQQAGNCANPQKNDCDRNAECIDVHPGRHFCACKVGYIGDGRRCDGPNCHLNISMCHKNAQCQLNGTCKCNNGYYGDGVDVCQLKGADRTGLPAVNQATEESLALTYSSIHASEFNTMAVTASSDRQNEIEGSGDGGDFSRSWHHGTKADNKSLFTTGELPWPRCTFANQSMCHEFAICAEESGECVCKLGYHGDGYSICAKDDEDCTFDPTVCDLRAVCDESTRTCKCIQGYIGDGIICAPDTFDCLLRPNLCSNFAKCIGRRCICIAGYTGDGTECVSIEPLQDCTRCDAKAMCYNETCVCDKGYFGNGAVCIADPKDCIHYPGLCHSNAVCDRKKRRCKCARGYTGNGMECQRKIGMCLNDRSICDQNADCLPSGICHCKQGFRGNGYYCHAVDVTQKTKGDILQCKQQCVANEECYRGECRCAEGYKRGSNSLCVDIDECLMGTHNCHTTANCTNIPGSFTCTCPTGYRENGRKCFQYHHLHNMSVDCEVEGITLLLANDPDLYNGRIFVRGQTDNPFCSKKLNALRSNETEYHFMIQYSHCDVRFEEPNSISVTLIIQRHPMFVTERADAYDVRCTYPVGARKVASHVAVSEITTAKTILETGIGPTCSLTVTDEKDQLIDTATVGQPLKLALSVYPNDTYAVLPRNCFAVNLETGELHLLTDQDGCAIDTELFPDWTYRQLWRTTASFRTFKWPDSSMIRFQCDCSACIGNCPEVNCTKGHRSSKQHRFRHIREIPRNFVDKKLEKHVVKGAERMAYSRALHVNDGEDLAQAQRDMTNWKYQGVQTYEVPMDALADGICIRTVWLILSLLPLPVLLVLIGVICVMWRKKSFTKICWRRPSSNDSASSYLKF